MNHQLVSHVLWLAIALGVAGCANMTARGVAKTAAFDHNCPLEKVHVIKRAEGLLAYEVDVCGQRRKYRDLGEQRIVFVDVTDGAPQQLPAQ